MTKSAGIANETRNLTPNPFPSGEGDGICEELVSERGGDKIVSSHVGEGGKTMSLHVGRGKIYLGIVEDVCFGELR